MVAAVRGALMRAASLCRYPLRLIGVRGGAVAQWGLPKRFRSDRGRGLQAAGVKQTVEGDATLDRIFAQDPVGVFCSRRARGDRDRACTRARNGVAANHVPWVEGGSQVAWSIPRLALPPGFPKPARRQVGNENATLTPSKCTSARRTRRRPVRGIRRPRQQKPPPPKGETPRFSEGRRAVNSRMAARNGARQDPGT